MPSPETTAYEAPLEQVWRTCEYLQHGEGKKCKRCPRREDWDEFGPEGKGAKRMCFGSAEQLINVVEAGNPWRDERPWP